MADLKDVLADILPAQESTPEIIPDIPPAPGPDEQGQQTKQEDPEAKAKAEPADDADEPKAEDKGEDDQPDDQPKRKPGSAKWRERAQELERELASYRQREAPAGDEKLLAKAVEDRIGAPPKRDDYESFLDYDVARMAYEVDKRQVSREVKAEAQRAQNAEQNRFAELVESFQEAEAEARTKIPDYDEVMKRASSIETRPHLDHLVIESDKGPLLKHYLAQRPDAVDRLNRMSPVAAAKEIGRLEARLSYPAPKTATKASPPVSAPSGGAKSPDGSDLDSDPSWSKFVAKQKRWSN